MKRKNSYHLPVLPNVCINPKGGLKEAYLPIWACVMPQKVVALHPLKLTQGCHGQRKVREKRVFFKVREKSGNFASSQGNSKLLVKVSEKSGILFSGCHKL